MSFRPIKCSYFLPAAVIVIPPPSIEERLSFTKDPADFLKTYMKHSVSAMPVKSSASLSFSSSLYFFTHFLYFLSILSIFSSANKRHSSYSSPFNGSLISSGRVSISARITSSISFISLSIHPSSWNTQISPAYFSIAMSSRSLTDGHSFGFPLPLPFPFPFLALVSATALLEQVSIAAMVLSPNDVPAFIIKIFVSCSSFKQRLFSSSFSPFPPFPPLPPLPPFPAFFAITETTARERTTTRIKDLMVLGVVED